MASDITELGYHYVMICPKCGSVGIGRTSDPILCTTCSQGYVVPVDYDVNTFWTHPGNSSDPYLNAYNQDQKVREQYGVEKLDPKCVRIREEHDRTVYKFLPPLPDPVVECPYCHSTDTTKITATQKVVNTALFGIFGNKRKHQWHCNNCKSDF